MLNYLPTKYLFLFLFCFYFSISTFGQEICDNGIDDNANGLIDYQEEACVCNNLINTSVYGDFEEYSCCPDGPTGFPGTGLDCLIDGWGKIGSVTNADYFNTCGYMGGVVGDFVPEPLPSGQGAAGFITEVGHAEYIGTCLENPFIAGENYDIEFHFGFNAEDPGIASPSPYVVGLFGLTTCSLGGANENCLSTEGWELLKEISVTGLDSSWTFVSDSFIPNDDFKAFAIGPSCGELDGTNKYHFVDNIIITGNFFTQEFDLEEITMTGNCVDGVTLQVNQPNGIDYQWYFEDIAIPGATSSSYNLDGPLQEGEYSVYIETDLGCGTTDPITVEIDFDVLNVNADITNNDCFGGSLGSIDLTVENQINPVSYNWSTGETTASIANLSSGQYDVTITDTNGCYSELNLDITNPPELQGNISNVIHPNQDNPLGSATATIEGGTPPYSYFWSNTETQSTATMLPPGENVLTVFDDLGCEFQTSIIINPVFELDVTSTNVSCGDECDGTIDLSIEGGEPPYIIMWNNGSASQQLTDLCANNYTALITDQAGTQLTVEVLIIEHPAIEIDAMYSNEVCSASADGYINILASGGIPEYSYSWNTGDSIPNLENLVPGTYDLTVTDEMDCEISESYTIEEVEPFTFQYSITNTGCDGNATGSIILNNFEGSSPFQFLWNTGETTQNLMNLMNGIYTVTISDNSNCEQIATYTVNEETGITVVDQIENVSCPGNADGSISLVVSGGQMPYTINWPSLGVSGPDVTNLPTGEYLVEIVDNINCSWNAVYTILENEAVTIDATTTHVLCAGGDTGSLDIEINSGFGPFSYLWSNGEVTQDVSNLLSGPYSVDITDANNCITNFDFVIEDGSTFSINLVEIVNAGCLQDTSGSIDITIENATLPITYVWSNGEISEDITNLETGSYTVTVFDGNNCSATNTFEVLQDSELEISVTTVNTLCHDSQDGQINMTVLEGTPPFQFIWTNGETTQSLTDLSPGIYGVTITDVNLCVLESSYEIQSPDSLNFELQIQQPTCEDGGFIEVMSPDINTLSFQWSTGDTTALISNLAPNTYSVTITDLNGCMYTDASTLDIPDCNIIVSVEEQTIKCEGETASINITITGGTLPFTYSIIDEVNGNSIDGSLNSPPYSIQNLSAGNYSLTIVSNDGEMGFTEFNISQIDPLTVQLDSGEDFSGFDIDCFGNETGTLIAAPEGGTPPYQHSWNTGATDAQIFNLPAGNYSVTVTDSNSCSVESNIALIEPSLLELIYEIEHPNCIDSFGGSVAFYPFGGAMPYQYEFDGNDPNFENTYDALTDGLYDISIFDANGCRINDQIEIEQEPSVAVKLGEDFTIENGNTVTLVATIIPDVVFDTIIWGGPIVDLCENCVEQTISPTTTSTYSVTLVDQNGCGSHDEIVVNVESNNRDFQLPNIFSPNGDGINDRFIVRVNSDNDQLIQRITIYDRWGERIFSANNFLASDPNMSWDGTIEGKLLNPGVFIYIVEYIEEGESKSHLGNLTLIK